MPEKITRWVKFKRFLKRNMTPLWAKRFTYQVLSFIISVAMVVGVAMYAFTKSYDSRKLVFQDGFTITAHSGAFETEENSLDFVKKAIEKKVTVAEIDIQIRPNGEVVMGHDIITTNTDGVELSKVFELVSGTDLQLNLDVKTDRALKGLYEQICKYSLNGQVFLTGIGPDSAEAAKKECPGIDYYINIKPSRFKIFNDDYQQKILKMLKDTGGIGINCNHMYASKTLSDLLHDNGYKLSVWTVDDKIFMKRALINKPDNITTHQVELLNEVIDTWGK